MRVAAILLACVAHITSAQFQDDIGGLPQRGQLSPIPIRATRFQRPPTRPGSPLQPALANQRIRRPIAFKPRGGSTAEDALGIGSYPRPVRPGPPNVLPPAFSTHVKPVNEEIEEEPSRETAHARDDREEEQESEEIEDESEENVARAVANLGAVGSTGASRSSGNGATGALPPQPAPVQYRPQGGPIPTGRGIPGTAPSPPVQYRPSPKPTKPRKQVTEEPVRQTVKVPVKPSKPSQSYDARGKKPVAQIIRRYRNDNPDGSITWGFENDDGSYKEELIGVDCITRGKYGYVDPDGLRREYTYETGIKCDEQQREEEEENGFVDYQENKLVLPDGKTIDLSTMGKKQARRPRPY